MPGYYNQLGEFMFHNIPAPIQAQMDRLERIDAQDRVDGTPRLQRLRQIPPETGRFLALLAANAPDGKMIEIGSSAGYSTLWLSLVCRTTDRQVTTFEILEDKARLARQTFQAAQIEAFVNLVEGDAVKLLPDYKGVAFCFLDAEKEVYGPCYEAVILNMVSGGLLVADNAINHRATLQPMIDSALGDRRVDAMVVPVGKGLLVCRKL
jgi:predicted O-methyltransferase YrrM